jgi:hypothetical protein
MSEHPKADGPIFEPSGGIQKSDYSISTLS